MPLPGVSFQLPDLDALLREGLLPVDMHVHTRHSDGFITLRDIRAIRVRSGLSVAVTDHNSISGVREAWSDGGERCGVLPGVEVSASDGPHILLYFERFSDLEDWFSRSVQRRIGECPYMAVSLTSQEIVDSAAETGALVIAAHPYGYALLPRGLIKCVENGMLSPDIACQIHGLEVLSGVLLRRLNERAVRYARRFEMVMTGGSDAHSTRELGHVVTGAEAESPGEFLEELRKRRNLVIGVERRVTGHLITGSAVLSRYIPYLYPGIKVHLEQNIPVVTRLIGKAGRSKRKQE